MIDGPAERLLRDGARVLSDAELLAVLIGRGRPQHALTLAEKLLEDAGGLGDLFERIDLEPERQRAPDRARLQAIREIAARLSRAQLATRALLDDPGKVANYLVLRFAVADQEVMGALFLNVRNRLIAEQEIFRGTLNRAAVEPRQILKPALAHRAFGLILFHTHPSGDATPSREDLLFTQRIKEACDLLGLQLLDHLILGGLGRWTSLSRLGALG